MCTGKPGRSAVSFPAFRVRLSGDLVGFSVEEKDHLPEREEANHIRLLFYELHIPVARQFDVLDFGMFFRIVLRVLPDSAGEVEGLRADRAHDPVRSPVALFGLSIKLMQPFYFPDPGHVCGILYSTTSIRLGSGQFTLKGFVPFHCDGASRCCVGIGSDEVACIGGDDSVPFREGDDLADDFLVLPVFLYLVDQESDFPARLDAGEEIV